MIALADRNIKERSAIVDHRLMPRGQCDLNFRHPGLTKQPELLSLWLFAAGLKTAVAAALVWTVREYPVSPTILVCLGIPYGLFIAVSRHRQGVAEAGVLKAGLFAFLTVPIVGSIVFKLLSLPPRQLEIGLLLFGCIPLLIRAADQIARHAAWWVTANPCVSHRAMTMGRVLWNDRFLYRVRIDDFVHTDEQKRAVDGLRTGLGFCSRSMILATSMILGLHVVLGHRQVDVSQRYLSIVGGIQLLVFFVNHVFYPQAGRYFLKILKHWCFRDIHRPAPPVVWRSPSGTSQRRRWQLTMPLSLLGVVFLGFELEHAASIQSWNSLTVWLLVVRALVIICALPVLLLLVLFNLAAPVIWHFWTVFEAADSPLIDPEWTAFDGYSDRLQHSCNPTEQRCLYRGYHPDTGFPILVDQKLLFEHQLILGATGIGKTALWLVGQISQLIRRRDGAVVIIDCKGDRAMFHTARLEAERRGATFKWFTNKPKQSTYVFNPFNQQQLNSLTMQQIVGLFMMSLNLHHGDDYGRAWFGLSSRMLFQEALRSIHSDNPLRRPFSFAEIERVLRKISAEESEFRAAQHLAFIVANLSQFEQLNLSPVHDPTHPAVRNAIHMPEVLAEKQVVYFHLVGAIDIGTVGEIARLAMYSAVSAAIDYRDRFDRRPCLHFIIDEAQMAVAQNIEAVLAQARDFGISFTLSLQTLSQLNRPGGSDLRELVLNNTTVKQYFSARDPESQQHIMKISGEVGYFGASWKQFVSRVREGKVSPGLATFEPDREPEPQIAITQEVGPRLSAEDISDISRHPNRCIMNVGRTQGFSSYLGAFPVHVDFTMPETEYERRSNAVAWPDGGEETIEIAPYWPDANPHTIVAPTHPPIIGPGQSIGQDKLNELKRRLHEED